MKILRIIILAVLLAVPFCLKSQVHEEWDVRYRGINDISPYGKFVKYDNYGNVYVLAENGYTSSIEIVTIKYNSQGILQWASRFTGNVATGMVLDNLGNVYVCGNTGSSYNFILKYSSFGALQWQNYRTNGNINDMVIDDFGNIYITGSAYNASYSGIETAKINPAGTVLWTQLYTSSSGYNSGAKITLDNAGNVYSMGKWDNQGAYYTAVLKYDNNGTIIYNKTLSQVLYECINLGVDNAGNVYYGGTRWGTYQNMDYALFKLNSAGTELWSRYYNGEFNSHDKMYGMEVNGKGDAIVAGRSKIDSLDHSKVTIIRYDSSGTIKWKKDISNGASYVLKVAMTKDIFGNVYTTTNNSSYNIISTAKYDTSGTQKWQIDYIGTNNSSVLQYISADNFGNVYLCGSTSGVQHPEVLTVRYLQSWNSNFTVTGCVSFKDNGLPVDGGYVKAVKLDKYSGSVVTVDSTPVQVNGYYSLKRIITDSLYIIAYPPESGAFAPSYYPQGINWKNAIKMYASSNMSDININVQRTESINGDCTIKGKVMKADKMITNLKDAILYVKSGGSFTKYSVTDGNGMYQINSVLQGSAKIFVERLGYSSDSISMNLVSGITYENVNFNLSQIYVGIVKRENKIPSMYSLGQNYPNPFNPITNVKFSIVKAGDVKIVVYDVRGREVQTLVNERLNAGTYEARFDGSGLTSGVYFYRMVTEGFTETRKMILLK